VAEIRDEVITEILSVTGGEYTKHNVTLKNLTIQ
jgi:hypothetical protein